jgi:hypothetical protein
MKKSILLPPEIETKFRAISDMIWDAIVEKEFFEKSEVRSERGGGVPPSAKRDLLAEEGAALLEEIRLIVQSALRDSKLATPA